MPNTKTVVPYTGTPEQEAKLKAVIEEYKDVPGGTMPVMQQAQEIFGYLPEEVQIMIAEGMGIPLEEVYGISTFYSLYNLNPKGQYKITVCLGTACYVKGSQAILDKVVARLGCPVGSISPDGKYLFFSEFSADEIGRLDVYAGGVRGYCRAATLHPDYGPRHLLFDASGKHLYVIGELSGDITVFDYADGVLAEKQVVKADRMDARGAADIHISPDGKFLYASLRLRGDGIVVFEIGPGGVLNYVGYTATGPHPRNFNITPNGRYVLVCCRDNDSVEVYSRAAATGLLTFTGRRLTVSRPVCVGW